jgi:hypothetical protein
MREICIKTTTSENHKRKNLLITEQIDQEGLVAKAEKKYSYYVSEQGLQADAEQLKNWAELTSQAQPYHKKNRHVCIRKIYDNKTGVGQMVYRVIGCFYVVQNLHVFAVVFMHSIKFDMLTPRLPETQA